MSVVYITSQGAQLNKLGERLVVKKGKNIIRYIHTKDIEQLIILGNITLTAPVITFLLKNKIDTVFLSYYGKYKGRLVGELGNNIFLRLKQYKFLSNEKNSLELAKKCVTAKLENTLYLLQYRNYRIKSDKISSAFLKIKNSLSQIDNTNDFEKLRGLEGISAKYYFSVFNEFFPSGPFEFHNRSRRPPKDEINALLSLGYTLLFNQISTFVYISGLDPFFGAFHTPDYSRQSLVLDLMEEFRPVIDDWIISLVNKAQISPRHFQYNKMDADDEDQILLPVMLTLDGMKKFVTGFNALINKKYFYNNEKHSLKNIFNLQCRLMVNAISSKKNYIGFNWKRGKI
jgi:CRISPR-associated protein Cas1